MAKYRHDLPQLTGKPFLTDGGIETHLLFNEGFEIPCFASFCLLQNPSARAAIEQWFHRHCQIAQHYKCGFILESLTWRASSDWAAKLGYSSDALSACIDQSVAMFAPFREAYESEETAIVFSGCLGPRGDGYAPDRRMSVMEAEDYHSTQVETFSHTDVDMISALTLNYVEEAIGIARAAKSFEMPIVISFTLETDGNLPTGQTLQSAIEQVEIESDHAPIYYMINCAHPTHFMHIVSTYEPWHEKIRCLRANSSVCSHAELDESQVLDMGNPQELGMQYRALREKLPNLNVLGGCCGTDDRHIQQIAKNCFG